MSCENAGETEMTFIILALPFCSVQEQNFPPLHFFINIFFPHTESFLDEFMDIKPALAAKLHVTAKGSCGSDDGVESPVLKTVSS